MLKKILRKLQLFDGIWSIPAAILMLFVWGKIQEQVFNDPMVSIEWFSFAVEAGIILIFATGLCIGGTYFTFRGFFNFFYKQDYKLYLKTEFDKLPAWLKVFSFPLLFFSLMVVFLIIYHIIVK